MALSGSIVWEVRTGGSDTNGGGFKTGATGTDWTLQNSAQYSVTDAVTSGTTTITSSSANFGTDVVGNVLYITGGTAPITAGWYEIITRNSSSSITVDRSTGLTTGTGATLNIGGALASPGLAASLVTVSGQSVWCKSGTYNISTSTAGAGGPLVFGDVRFIFRGYQTTRGDLTGTRPLIFWNISAPGGLTYMITLPTTTGSQSVINVALDGNSTSNVSGISVASARGRLYQCLVSNCSAANMYGYRQTTSSNAFVQCYAYNCKIGFSTTNQLACPFYCVAISCGDGFSGGSSVRCIAHACTTSGITGGASTQHSHHVNCIADGTTGGPGFNLPGDAVCINCLSANNSTYGYDVAANTAVLISCASYNNTSGRNDTTLILDAGAITLSADPFVDSANGDFRPNTTSGGGLLLRAAGIGVYGQTDANDIGAVQHADPSAPILIHPGMSGGMRA